jgi:ADP-ribose pyrophosphatase YjhB (NUDIX family)
MNDLRYKPSTTVAAIIEREGRFLLVEEHTPEGLRLNNPAGHLDAGESLLQACVREGDRAARTSAICALRFVAAWALSMQHANWTPELCAPCG